MKNPVMKVYRAYDEMFINSKALVSEYHDVLRAQWFATLQCIASTNANAVNAFSPPDNEINFLLSLPFGFAIMLIPPANGFSSFSKINEPSPSANFSKTFLN